MTTWRLTLRSRGQVKEPRPWLLVRLLLRSLGWDLIDLAEVPPPEPAAAPGVPAKTAEQIAAEQRRALRALLESVRGEQVKHQAAIDSFEFIAEHAEEELSKVAPGRALRLVNGDER